MTNQKVLIFGSSGLLGSSIFSLFQGKSSYDILAPSKSELNLFDYHSVEKYIEIHRPNFLINCAAKVGGLYSQIRQPATYLQQNISITNNIFNAVYSVSSNTHIINFMSTCCFPISVKYPITEDQLHEGPPHETNYSYSYAKRMIEIYSSSFFKEFKISSTNFIFGNLFGLNDHFNNPNDAHVIPALIVKAFKAIDDKTFSFQILGDGTPLREFLYANDAAKIVYAYLDKMPDLNGSKTLLFSNPNAVTIFNLASMISKTVSPDKDIMVVKEASTDPGQSQKPSKSSQTLTELQDFEFTPLGVALDEVVKHYLKYYRGK